MKIAEQMRKNNEVSIDINKLANSVKEELDSLHPLSDKCSIYRVPKRLRRLDERFYTPQVVSIGPFHYGNKDLKAMEDNKRRYLQYLLEQSKVSMQDFLEFIKDREISLRNCYAETIELSSDEFVKMILLDSAFIIVLFLKSYFEGSNRDIRVIDRIHDRPWSIDDVTRDSCLLENQLPLFILDDLFKFSNIIDNNGEELSMIKLTHVFFNKWSAEWVSSDILKTIDSSNVEHFVDFLRLCQQPSNLESHGKMKRAKIPNVTELYQAGVTFKRSSSENIFDIKFQEGILEMPQLVIEDTIEMLLRNIQAFEQLHCVDRQKYINYYIALMNFLVKTPKDVEILVDKEIIANLQWNDEAVATLVHDLGKEDWFSPTNFCFIHLGNELNTFCKRPWNRWKATLKQKYFNTPWTAINVIGAVILLILAFIQSVCSIIQAT